MSRMFGSKLNRNHYALVWVQGDLKSSFVLDMFMDSLQICHESYTDNSGLLLNMQFITSTATYFHVVFLKLENKAFTTGMSAFRKCFSKLHPQP